MVASTHVFANRSLRAGEDARPYKRPITQEKPPGMVTERLVSSIAYVRDAL